MGHGRKQISIGSLMALIAVVALGLGSLRALGFSGKGALTLLWIAFQLAAVFVASFVISQLIVFRPCFLLIEAFGRRRDARARVGLSPGRRP